MQILTRSFWFKSTNAFKLTAALGFLILQPVRAEKLLTLETAHYRIAFTKNYEPLAGEILQVAESVWPTLAKAYDSYNHYETIDILIKDDGDDANGFAIYNFSRVAIFAPHMDWVMRNRHGWIRNVVTHELAHIFTLRRAAYLSPVDEVNIFGSTYSYTGRVNYSFQIPWLPLVAPTWYIEGIAQFEAAQNGNDTWDSQRDMVLRDAYLTGTLPSLDFIETFEHDEDWTQSERCYNTGFAFLLYLKERFGVDKVRALATPKPIFNFSYSVKKTFGKELPDLFGDFKRSLADRYAEYKEIPNDELADKTMGGSYQQNLAFSSDGRYMAWLGNDDDRRAPLNWIYWKELGRSSAHGSLASINHSDMQNNDASNSFQSSARGSNGGSMSNRTNRTNRTASSMPLLPTGITTSVPQARLGNPLLGLARNHLPAMRPNHYENRDGGNGNGNKIIHDDGGLGRSDEAGSEGLEFNHANSKLLTARQNNNARYTDLWEYDFKSRADEEDKWHRLTWEERAAYPSYHPTQNLIVYTRKNDVFNHGLGSSSNIALLDSNGKTTLLTRFANGEQVYNPRFNPKGDSIYFTLGIEDKEAIVVVSAHAAGYDVFSALRDSSLFPDSLKLAKAEKLTFVTPLKQGAIRNLKFSGDTLFWASNSEGREGKEGREAGQAVETTATSIYNIYAKLPNDSALYRATHVSGQALQPLILNGNLYYQGYRKQRFQIFKQPLTLTRTPVILSTPSDTLVNLHTKKIDYTKNFQSGEYTGTRVALNITPYLALQPQLLSGDESYTDMALGLSLTFGEAYGEYIQTISAALTKRLNYRDPLNYQLAYSGVISTNAIRHTTSAWTPDFYYSLYHDVIDYNQTTAVNEINQMPAGLESDIGEFTYKSEYSRYAAYSTIPLPFQFYADASFWQQSLSQNYSENIAARNLTTGVDSSINSNHNFFRDALEHRHLTSGLNWSYGKGMWGTYLPTGGWLTAGVHKWWATFQNGTMPLNATNAQQSFQSGNIPGENVFTLAEYNPWSLDLSLNATWSNQKTFTLFATTEGGAFLSKAPTFQNNVRVTATSSTQVENLENGLWAMTYRIGYYKLGGYPYNFMYRGRDLMEGTSYNFGQVGVQLPIKLGAFLPDLPTTSLKQFMLTAMGEWGTTLIAAPDHIYEKLTLDQIQNKPELLLDYGLRASLNFHLYHQIPFTIFAQVFLPYNKLKAELLYWDDYPHRGRANPDGSPSAEQIANDPVDKQNYFNEVKNPRFFIGFNLGIF